MSKDGQPAQATAAHVDEDLTYFQAPKFDSVIDRYYTRFYKQVDQRVIDRMLNPNAELKQDKEVSEANLD